MNTKTTQTKHTQGELAIKRALTRDDTNEIVDSEGLTVAECPRHGAAIVADGHIAPWHMAKANAAELVHRWNRHPVLMQAIDDILTQAWWSENDQPSPINMESRLRAILECARNAKSIGGQS